MDPNSKSFPSESAPIKFETAMCIGQNCEYFDADKPSPTEISASDQIVRHSKNNAIGMLKNQARVGKFWKDVQPADESKRARIE